MAASLRARPADPESSPRRRLGPKPGGKAGTLGSPPARGWRFQGKQLSKHRRKSVRSWRKLYQVKNSITWS